MLGFLLLLCLPLINSLNVLVFSPAVLTSPVIFMSHIADTLTKARHNVTVLSPIVDVNLRQRVGYVKTNDLIIVEPDEIMKKELGPAIDPTEAIKLVWEIVEDAGDFETNYKWIFDHTLAMCPNIFRNEEIMSELMARDIDVALTESLTVCGLALFKKLGIEKTIITTSFTVLDFESEYSGEPRYVSYVPSTFSVNSDRMNILERYQNYRTSNILQKTFMNFNDQEIQHISKYGLGFDWRELYSSASAYFVNSNPYLDFPRPVLQKTIPIGGVSVDLEDIKSQKLDKIWEEILNKRERSMLISFGSIAKSQDMPIEWRENILNVIRSIPNVTFIWKYESEWAPNVENVHFVKWVPQTVLLADERVTAFLTHCGLGSTLEVAHLGKPALMVPLFGDQMRNARMLARHNGSIYFDKFKLSDFKLLKEAFHDVLFDETYRKNAERLAELLRNQPSSSANTVVKHVEFIGKYGPFPNMDPYGRKLSRVQREMIDVFAIMYISYFMVFVIILVLLKILYTCLCGSVKQKIN